MNNKTNKLIPDLRFPEFVNEGEWEEKKVDEIANVIASGDLDASTFSQKITNTHIYPIYSNSVSNEGIYGYNNYPKYKPNSVTITARGTLGAAFVRNVEFVGIGRLLVVSDFDNVDSVFFKENWNHYAKIPLENGGIPQLTAITARSIKLLYPKLREQQKIASCLSSLDEVIAAHNQKLEALKEHKKGLMQNLFPQEGETVPKKRFPEFKNDEDWETGKLGDLIDTLMGNAFRSEDFVEQGVQLIRMGNLYQGDLQLNRARVFLPTRFEEEYSRFLISPRDLLMSMTGTIGKMRCANFASRLIV